VSGGRRPTRKVEAAWATFKPTMTEAELVEHLMTTTGMTRAQAERHAAKCFTTDKPDPRRTDR
jgi:hypothetical protein